MIYRCIPDLKIDHVLELCLPNFEKDPAVLLKRNIDPVIRDKILHPKLIDTLDPIIDSIAKWWYGRRSILMMGNCSIIEYTAV